MAETQTPGVEVALQSAGPRAGIRQGNVAIRSHQVSGIAPEPGPFHAGLPLESMDPQATAVGGLGQLGGGLAVDVRKPPVGRDPTGLRVVDYVDRSQWGRAIMMQTTPDNVRYYQGVIFSTEGRPTEKLDYHVSHSLSWNTFRAPMTSNPRQALFNQGWSAADVRHFTRVYGAYYVFPWMNLGAAFVYRTGGPSTRACYSRELNNRSLSRSPSGTGPGLANDPNGISELRDPAFTQLDLKMITNLLATNTDQSLNLVLDVFNAFNTRVPTGFVSTDLPTFGQITGRQDPLRIQLGLTYTY